MLFDSGENIVIVPPKPDAFLNHTDEFTYSNLYDYDDCCGGSTATATTAATFQLVTNSPRGSGSSSSSDVVAELNPEGEASSSTLSSSNANGERNADDQRTAAPANRDSITRDPRNGAFTFQVHSEYDLLLHVQKDLDKYRRATAVAGDVADDGSGDVRLSETIMRSVDEYCLRKQWMYHIGREKGEAIARFLRDGAEHYLRSGRGNKDGEAKPAQKYTCVDLGTYCGYSALVMASALRGFVRDLRQHEEEPTPFEFHIYTTEVSTKLINVAQSMFRLAKMDAHITPILIKGEGEESLSESLRRHGVEGVVDFLLLDHAKHLYLDDLRDLEGAGLIGAGSRVGADNVVFNRLDAYRDHVRDLASRGVAETRLEEMNLEYSNNLKDGLELTVYLQNPPLFTE